VHIFLRIPSCTLETTQAWEFQPAVPKQAAPLAADIFVSAIMLHAVFAFESLTLAAYILSQQDHPVYTNILLFFLVHV
jgi:hypothetical protein